VLGAEAIFEHRPDGTLCVRSPLLLRPYPERLEHWAVRTPDRTFLAQGDSSGAWRPITNAQSFRRVRAIAQALLERKLNAERPVASLSDNGIEHAPELTTLRFLWERLGPVLVFAADGAAFRRAARRVLDSHTEFVTIAPSFARGDSIREETGVEARRRASGTWSGSEDGADGEQARSPPAWSQYYARILGAIRN